MRSTPSRSLLRSADSRMDLADRPSTSRLNPLEGAFGRAPSFVAMVISSPMPRLRIQRPSSSSLSPPCVPFTKNA